MELSDEEQGLTPEDCNPNGSTPKYADPNENGDPGEFLGCLCYRGFIGETCSEFVPTTIKDKLLRSYYFWIPAFIVAALVFVFYLALLRTPEIKFHARKLFVDIVHIILLLTTGLILSWLQFPTQEQPAKEWNNGFVLVLFSGVVFLAITLITEAINPLTACGAGILSLNDFFTAFLKWKPVDIDENTGIAKPKAFINRIFLYIWWIVEELLHLCAISFMGYYGMTYQIMFHASEVACLIGWVGYWSIGVSVAFTIVVYIAHIFCILLCQSSLLPRVLKDEGGANEFDNGNDQDESRLVVVLGTGKCCFRAKTASINQYHKCIRSCIVKVGVSGMLNNNPNGGGANGVNNSNEWSQVIRDINKGTTGHNRSHSGSPDEIGSISARGIMSNIKKDIEQDDSLNDLSIPGDEDTGGSKRGTKGTRWMRAGKARKTKTVDESSCSKD